MEEKRSQTKHLRPSRFEGQELYACEWSFLEECTLAVSDLFWKKSDGRLYRLAQKGDFLDHEKLKKFYDRNSKIYSSVTQIDDFENYLEETLLKYCEAEFENERLVARQELISFFFQFYYLDDSHADLFDLVHVFDRRFNLLRENYPEFLLSYPDYQRRNALIGSLNVLGAIILGYNSEVYLKDIYTIAFFYQVSTYSQMSVSVAQAFDLERKSQKAFGQYVLNLSEKDQRLIFEHMHADAQWLKENYTDLLAYESSYQLLLRYHERVNGTGFPHQLCQEEISDIELWILLVSRTFPLASFQYRSEDAKELIPKLLSGAYSGEELPAILGRRIKLLVEAVFIPFNSKEAA